LFAADVLPDPPDMMASSPRRRRHLHRRHPLRRNQRSQRPGSGKATRSRSCSHHRLIVALQWKRRRRSPRRQDEEGLRY
jgi:hypothetical protein